VFFGCRKRSKDYLYENEWLRLKEFIKSHLNSAIGSSGDSVVDLVAALRSIWDGSLSNSNRQQIINTITVGHTSTTGYNNNNSNISTSTTAGTMNQVTTKDIISTNAFLFTAAFSQDDPERKVYVTHNLRTHHEHVRQTLLETAGYVFISGSGKQMPSDVRHALIDALSYKPSDNSPFESTQMPNSSQLLGSTTQSAGGEDRSSSSVVVVEGPTKAEAEQFLSALQRKGRYILDTWS